MQTNKTMSLAKLLRKDKKVSIRHKDPQAAKEYPKWENSLPMKEHTN